MLSTVDELKGNTTEETIRKFIGEQVKLFSQNLPDYKKLYDYQIRNEELPKTSTRKVKRHLVTWIRQ
jgi:long-chain acyl-CoA synthetase